MENMPGICILNQPKLWAYQYIKREQWVAEIKLQPQRIINIIPIQKGCVNLNKMKKPSSLKLIALLFLLFSGKRTSAVHLGDSSDETRMVSLE